MKLTKRHLFGFAAIAMSLSAVGCETLTSDSAASKKKKKDSSWFSFKKKEYQVPQSMTATWTHDILTLPGKAPTRGFGGRFYFYNEKTQAIPVDGDLVVYGFDDTNKQQMSEDLSQATKRFRFTAEQFTTHFTEGELGASYSVWIPWDEAYGAPKKIMLIPTFMTKDGRTIRGAAANLNLPGSGKDETSREVAQRGQQQMATQQVQQASALVPYPNNGLPDSNFQNTAQSSGMRTTTIQVPSNSLMRTSYDAGMPVDATGLQNQTVNTGLLQNNSGQINNTWPAATVPTEPQPSAVPFQQHSMTTRDANGWVSPVYAQADWSALAPRSAPSQSPAQASQVAQPSFYPIR